MTGKLIIIEAGDGCGKATQSEKLYQRLLAAGYLVRKVEYPNYASQSSALIKMYLQGDFGHEPDAVNPYAASAFYAVDRYASYKQDWAEFYAQGGIVICDRYTTSNMVHQAVKITDDEERERFLTWLWDFEFTKMGLPVPDTVLLLDMPPQHSAKLIANRCSKGDLAAADIHEKNSAYLARCYQSYQHIAERYQWQRIACTAGEQVRSIEAIHEDVYQAVSVLLAAD